MTVLGEVNVKDFYLLLLSILHTTLLLLPLVVPNDT